MFMITSPSRTQADSVLASPDGPCIAKVRYWRE